MKGLKDLFNDFFNSEGQEKTKKSIQNLAIFLLIGVILLIVGGFFTNENTIQSDKDKDTQNTPKQLTSDQKYFDEYDKLLENKVTDILSKVKGVGKVDIAITYSTGKEIVPARNIQKNKSKTREKDKEGGIRRKIENDTNNEVIVSQQSKSEPVVLKVIPPQVKGVVVVAEGVNDPKIKVDVSRAVSTVLGISLSKVQVYPMNEYKVQ